MSTELAEKFYQGLAIPDKENIKALEDELKQMPQVELPLQHIFAEGAYMRVITLPKDTVLTSRVHKTQHISVIVSGDVTISKPDGTKERVQGPYFFITEPNTKRAIAVHEETLWLTFHVTDEVDVEAIVNEVSSEEYQ